MILFKIYEKKRYERLIYKKVDFLKLLLNHYYINSRLGARLGLYEKYKFGSKR
jgi:hypothetical protein